MIEELINNVKAVNPERMSERGLAFLNNDLAQVPWGF